MVGKSKKSKPRFEIRHPTWLKGVFGTWMGQGHPLLSMLADQLNCQFLLFDNASYRRKSMNDLNSTKPSTRSSSDD